MARSELTDSLHVFLPFQAYLIYTMVRGLYRVQGEQYLVGKRQEIIVVTEHLHGPRMVLGGGVTGGSFDLATNSHTPFNILGKVYLTLGHLTRERTRHTGHF